MVILGVIIAILIYSMVSGEEASRPLEAEVQMGEFEILVTVTGELQAERSIDIQAPMTLRSRRLRYQSIMIQDLVPEGTVVDSGDYVATLDRAAADNSYKDALDELEMAESAYTRTKLDTTLQLRQLRDELINLKFNMEEAEITLEQSKFEPPATIRQAQINLDKAERAYQQAVQNYEIKVEQARADMTEVRLDLADERRTTEEMAQVLENFVIHAPAPGMVIYKREWSGQKRTVGSEISTHDLTVAQLPDMSTMISKTYVNEIDISKIQQGQVVRIGVDAFPEKRFTGYVSSVANIGEQLPNTDAKVFEVTINLNESDPILRPSMTTSNRIVTMTFDSVLYVPLEAIHSTDSMTFVYKKNHTKQVVVLGEFNENEIIVEAGLEMDDRVFLSIPDGAEEMKFEGLELVEVIRRKEAEKERLEEEQQKLREQQVNQRQRGRMRMIPPSGDGAGTSAVRPSSGS
jgi:multidrug efflux pump subunit AcrA (membrane-fusion protein)